MTGPDRFSPELLEQIRSRVSIEAMIGRAVKLQRAGRHKKGLCPFHIEKTASFVVREENGTFQCYGCGERGNAIDWLRKTEGLGFRDAVRRLAENGGMQSELSIERKRIERASSPDDRAEAVDSAVVGKWIYRTAQPARGTIVEGWLRFRVGDPDGVPGALDRLLFHPACPVTSWLEGQGPRDAKILAPAMVAPIADESGEVYGVHCTYLATDGFGKAALPKAWNPSKQRREPRDTRKIFGRVAGLSVHLTALRGEGPLLVGEGIETTWDYAQGQAGPYRAVAALNLENLQGGEIRLRDGARPLWKPQSDPGRPPFLIRDPGEVVVLVDADMKPLRDQRVQLCRGGSIVEADISGLQRAELCAALAVQAWKRAGATRARAERPPMGMDFNDAGRAARAKVAA